MDVHAYLESVLVPTLDMISDLYKSKCITKEDAMSIGCSFGNIEECLSNGITKQVDMLLVEEVIDNFIANLN